VGHFYFGVFGPQWVNFQSALTQVSREVAGPTVRTGALALLLNPVSAGFAAVAAATGIYLAIVYKAEQENFAFSKALVESGNEAGVTADQLQDMAKHMDGVAITQAKASQAIAMFASTGRVAAANLEAFSAVAIKLERTAGIPVQKTAQDFAELGRSPVKASRKLNEQYNYLTASVYDQVKALQAQGAIAAAGEIAQKAYADAQHARTKKLEESLGTLHRTGVDIGKIWDQAWNAILGIGRGKTPEE
jgi:phage-related minor tail protein